ncbi:MAG: TetR/AcrR family transcriptional regulator [Paraburkholderia sp.]|jgi:TetR/AcrR family transcriptional repressor of nem operon|uniref:TetR/AcrR family transcriptional regulator n=1 Tax=Paraburkholderia sp. TaxID=1926495 RepID=UPI00122254FC|nr:TetR/AcrR family transcriptional regulator [Paraburkholderia sp.]TAL97773.1 MAG: TetR/AcrR family transcriptional regulator [Paraburkholderia sp.]
MRKSRQETAETRQRIVEAASSRFRETGIDGTALADLMADAGLTHGGFYKHFGSKEQVVLESLQLAADSLRESMASTLSRSSGSRGLNAAIASYLSPEHRDDPGGGCPFVALASELARGSDEVRDATTTGLVGLVDLIAGHFDELPPAAARKKALVVLSTMIGALTMARMVNDEQLSATILREARKALQQ